MLKRIDILIYIVCLTRWWHIISSGKLSRCQNKLIYLYIDLFFHYWHVCLTRWWYIVSSSRLSQCPNKLQPCLIWPPCPPGNPGDAYNQLFIFIHIISLPFPGASVTALPDVRNFFCGLFLSIFFYLVRCLLVSEWDAQTLEGLVNIRFLGPLLFLCSLIPKICGQFVPLGNCLPMQKQFDKLNLTGCALHWCGVPPASDTDTQGD